VLFGEKLPFIVGIRRNTLVYTVWAQRRILHWSSRY